MFSTPEDSKDDRKRERERLVVVEGGLQPPAQLLNPSDETA